MNRQRKRVAVSAGQGGYPFRQLTAVVFSYAGSANVRHCLHGSAAIPSGSSRQWSFFTQALAWLLLSHSDAAFTASRPAHWFLAVCAVWSERGGV